MKHFALLFVGFLALPACGGVKTNVSPVADVANAGGKIEDSGQAIFQATIQARAASPTVVSQTTADAVAMAVNRLGHAGLTLNAALATYNQVKAAGGDLTAQRAAVLNALGVVNQFLADVGKALPAGTLQSVDTIVTSILDVVVQVRTGVGL